METLERTRAVNCSVALLDSTFDVDEIADLRRLVALPGERGQEVARHTASVLHEAAALFPLHLGGDHDTPSLGQNC
jgi:hypothetical protein